MLVYKDKNDAYTIGIWQITESVDTLLALLDEVEANALQAMRLADSRLLEKAATRVLLRELLKQDVRINYYPNGKPYLEEYPLNISISHTRGYAAIILSENENLGIDIEYISDRVNRIRSRFVSKDEYVDPLNETMHLLLLWSAKETMYKALSIEGVDLKDNFRIANFELQKSGVFEGQENISEQKLSFNICYQVSVDYVLTYTFASAK